MKLKGVRIVRGRNGEIRMDQRDKIYKLTVPATKKEFTSKKAMAQYVGVRCRPDICAAVQLIAPGG